MNHYIFDIETVPLPTDQLEVIMPVFDPESVKVGNYGPEKAAEKIEKARLEQFNRFMRDAALSALTGQVAMIGIRDESANTYIFSLPDEKTIISEWLRIFDRERGAHWIGFNISNFDLPFLIRRAWFHRLAIPYGILKGRYLSSRFTDLLQLWTASEYSNRFEVSLAELSKFFGAGTKTEDGAKFAELLRYKPDAARAYLANDLEITWKIAEAMGAFKRSFDPPAGSNGDPATHAVDQPESEIQFY